jgi:recombination DNA repair RAD52 pathway protein
MTAPLSVVQLERLHADLHPSRVANRDQGGRSLSYLEAYDVRATLVRIFGYGGFSLDCLGYEIVHQSTYKAPNSDRDLWRVAVVATMRLSIPQLGVTYTEAAAASQSGPDIGEVMDFALKTAESDALKRCAANLGSTFGLSLYRNGQTQDVVRVVYAPDQIEIVTDLNQSRTGDDTVAAAARERLQSRLKTLTGDARGEEPTEAAPEPRVASKRTPKTRMAPSPTTAGQEPVSEPVAAPEPEAVPA